MEIVEPFRMFNKRFRQNSFYILAWILPKKFAITKYQLIKIRRLLKSFLKLKRYRFDSRSELLHFTDHNDDITSVCFSPNNELFASGGHDRFSIIYCINPFDKNTYGKKILKFRDHKKPILTISFANNNLYFASGGMDFISFIYVINKNNENYGKQIFKFSDHKHNVSSTCFSCDSEYFLSGGWDKTCCMYGMNSTKPEKFGKLLYCLNDHHAEVTSACFSNNNEYLATSSADLTVILYGLNSHNTENQDNTELVKTTNLNNDNSIGKIIHCFKEHTDYILSVCFSEFNEYLATCSNDFITYVYGVNPINLSTFCKRVFKFDNKEWTIRSVGFSMYDDYIAMGGIGGNVQVYGINPQKKEEYQKLVFKFKYKTCINSVKFSSSGWLAIGSRFETVIYC